MNKPSIEIYLEWLSQISSDSVLSSGVLIERGNLALVDQLFLIQIPEEQQLRHLLQRAEENGGHLTEENALKAIRRQYPLEKLIGIAHTVLGEQVVHIIPYNSDLIGVIPPANYSR